jgi:hypothetical protein
LSVPEFVEELLRGLRYTIWLEILWAGSPEFWLHGWPGSSGLVFIAVGLSSRMPELLV